MTADRVTGVVLAAGRSSRLGRPKQLLPYDGMTLLGATLTVARRCPFDQLIVTLAGVAEEVRAAVELDGIGHPFWLGREVFGDLARMHGDKGVWKLVEKASASGGLTEVPVATTVPLDVDTWDDYQRLLTSATKAVPT